MKVFVKNHPFLFDRVVIVFICVILFLPFLGNTTLWDMDEAYFGSIAKEMHEQGEWIVPTFNGGAELGDKPILLFWCMRLSFLTFGITEFAARFPSVLWSIGTVLLIYQIGLRLFNRSIARCSAFVAVSMLMFCLESRAATTSAVLMFLFTVVIYTYVAGIYQKRTPKELETNTVSPTLKVPGCYFPQSIGTVIVLYGILSVAVLCKGPVFFILATAIIGLFFLIKSAPQPTFFSIVNPIHFFWTCGQMRLVTAIIMILLIAAPWYIVVGLKTNWEWWNLFFYKHHFTRATSTMHNAGGHFYYYIPALLFNTFPWSIFFIPACIDTFRRMCSEKTISPYQDGLLLMLCWGIVVMVAFSASATQFPSYIAPMFPAAAILYANFWFYWSKNEELCAAHWTPIALVVLVMVGVSIFVTFQFVIPIYWSGMFPGIEVLSYVGLIPVAIAGFGLSRNSPTFFRKTMGFQFMIFLMVIFFIGAPLASKYQRYGELFAIVKEDADEQKMPPLASVGCFEQSWVFYSGGPVKRITRDGINDFFVETNNRGVILIRDTDYEAIQEKEPGDSFRVIKTVPYFGRKFNIVAFTKK